ncbi:MAG TPA: hypothetical protein P5248_12285, partial [Bacteroidales bacterium]|nr:hypothetical protein [Bacteroidales bacterium]
MEEDRSQHIDYNEGPYLSRGCCGAPSSDEHQQYSCDLKCAKLSSWDWLKDLPVSPYSQDQHIVEVRFKNNRKEYYLSPDNQPCTSGDIVAVEGSPGHDIGIVSLTGPLAVIQMQRKGIKIEGEGLRKIYRKARGTDIEKWNLAISREEPAKIRTRQIAAELGL